MARPTLALHNEIDHPVPVTSNGTPVAWLVPRLGLPQPSIVSADALGRGRATSHAADGVDWAGRADS